MEQEVKVTFEPAGRSVFVLRGTTLLEAAARAGYIINTPCGGAGKCGKCLVRVTDGACPADSSASVLEADRLAEGYRLACRCRVENALVVEVPDASLFQSSQRILLEDSGEAQEVRPTAVKRFLEMKPPDRTGAQSDVELLRETVGPVAIDLGVLRALPLVLRESDFRVTATLVRNRLIDLEPGDTSDRFFGAAFDIGTTTLVGTLVDLRTGRDAAVSSRMNPQIPFGDDVISRIKKCREEKDGLSRLHEAIIGAVNAIAEDLARQAGIARAKICEAVFAGNTTMQQILCGINPTALGELPFLPAFRDALEMRAADLGLAIHPGADVTVFPQIGGFVGGDTVAGIVGTRLDRTPGPLLFVDVGTNGELVLAHDGNVIATSVAAGPAFEGARIVHGMRATQGAIEKVVADGDIRVNVVGNAKPSGICGTGLVDAVSVLLRTGVLDETGRILGGDELPAGVPPEIRRRIVPGDGQFDFVLAGASETATGEDLCLYQKDIRELQLANGAIRAGITILLKRVGLQPEDLKMVLLAGAFGNFIRRRNARRIGMLPQIPTDRIRFVGNTASFGAKRVLLSGAEKEYAAGIARNTQHVDLSLNPEFQMEFSAAMMFPEGEKD